MKNQRENTESANLIIVKTIQAKKACYIETEDRLWANI